MRGILPYAIDALLYAALAVYFWRTRWARREGEPRAARTAALEHHAVLAPLGVHGWLLAQSLFGVPGLTLGLGNAVSTILWLTVLIYWLGNYFYKLDGLQALVMP